MPQIVHRLTIFDDEERYPFGNVLSKEYPNPENQGDSFYDPKNLVKDLFVTGMRFVVGNVSEEFPHDLIFFLKTASTDHLPSSPYRPDCSFAFASAGPITLAGSDPSRCFWFCGSDQRYR